MPYTTVLFFLKRKRSNMHSSIVVRYIGISIVDKFHTVDIASHTGCLHQLELVPKVPHKKNMLRTLRKKFYLSLIM